MNDAYRPATPVSVEAVERPLPLELEGLAPTLFVDELDDHLSASALSCISTLGTFSCYYSFCSMSSFCTHTVTDDPLPVD